jgi:hypothetical protein
MKYKNKPCKICGEKDKGKRKVCLGCKTNFPSSISAKGKSPFNRREDFLKLKKKMKGGNKAGIP